MNRRTRVNRRTVAAARGLLAGAAGTTALDAATYLDMTIRGRPASTTPERSVQRLADISHVGLGTGDTAGNRRTGLGALLGYLTGAGVAAGYSALVGRRLPWALSTAVLAAGAMLASDTPLTLLRVTGPRTWSARDWAADLAPHLAYGMVTATALDRLR